MVLFGVVPAAKPSKVSGKEVFFFLTIPLKKWLLLLHFWMKEYPVSDAASDVQVDKNTTMSCDVAEGGVLYKAIADQYSSRWSWGSCASR